jgi:ankyrin repeat protein
MIILATNKNRKSINRKMSTRVAIDAQISHRSYDHELSEAIAADNVDAVRQACNDGASVNAYLYEGTRQVKPLHAVLLRDTSDPVEMVRILVHRGADVNVTTIDPKGEYSHLTPLHYAVLRSENVILYLIQNGANIDAVGTPSITPLHMAILHDKIYSARLLILAGADTYLPNHEGKTAYDLALEKGMQDLIDIIEKGEDKQDIVLDEYPENY